MKNIALTLLLLFLITNSLFAQKHIKRDQLKAYKVAYITQQLDLTPTEAEKFWPLYNKYDETLYQYRFLQIRKNRKLIKEKGGIDALTDEKANQILSEIITNDKIILEAKQELFLQLKNVISSKKILKLHRAEHEFNRKLLKEYRKISHPKPLHE